jgi:hypothetical protein
MAVSMGLVPRLSWTVDGSSHPCAFQNRRSIRLSRRSGSRSPSGSGNASIQISPTTHVADIHSLPFTPNPITMGTRASGSASTALRRLMTEYKQLTASGQSGLSRLSLFTFSLTHSSSQARPTACSQLVRDAFASGLPSAPHCALTASSFFTSRSYL